LLVIALLVMILLGMALLCIIPPETTLL